MYLNMRLVIGELTDLACACFWPFYSDPGRDRSGSEAADFFDFSALSTEDLDDDGGGGEGSGGSDGDGGVGNSGAGAAAGGGGGVTPDLEGKHGPPAGTFNDIDSGDIGLDFDLDGAGTAGQVIAIAPPRDAEAEVDFQDDGAAAEGGLVLT